ncbi:HEPN domain-containing protein [Nonomuraea sp. NPDC050404]|uniref:ApeA N-terminal domain 1-containing protein n=1 Tax=Nonomuraea sp. NPDC050404 TaxID=3155783 RepID=UPI0033C16A1D
MSELKPGDRRPAEWWLPEMAGTREVPGLYEILDSGAGRATLFKSLNAIATPFLEEDRSFELLHGRAFNCSRITLYSSRRSQGRYGIGPLSITELSTWLAIEGAWLSRDQLSISDARVEFHGQQDWSGWTSFAPDPSQPTYPPTNYVHTPGEVVSASMPGGTVSVNDRSGVSDGYGGEIILHSGCYFDIALHTPASFENFMKDWILPLEVLITMATGRPGGIKSLSITNREWDLGVVRHPSERWLKVRSGSKAGSGPRRPLHGHEVLFTLREMNWETQCPLIYQTVAKWEYTVELWATLLDPDNKWPLARFMSAIQAVEALDRLLSPNVYDGGKLGIDFVHSVLRALRDAGFNNKKRSKVSSRLQRLADPSLEARLRRLTQLLEPSMGNLCSEADWPSRVAKLRNIIAHGLPEARDYVFDSRALQVGTELALHMLESAWLHNAGFDAQDASVILGRRGNFGSRRKLVTENFHCLPKAQNR